MQLLIVIVLVAIASYLEAISDYWREQFQLYLEGHNDPKLWKKGKYWGYIPFNNKGVFPRDGWHLVKYFLFGSYMLAISYMSCSPSIAEFNIFYVFLLLASVRGIIFTVSLELIRKKKKGK